MHKVAFLLAAWCAPKAAYASCIITLSTPPEGAVVSSSPTFSWVGDCQDYRLWTWKDGNFAARRPGPWSPVTDRTPPEDTWDGAVSGAATLGWAVQGRAVDGSVNNYSSQRSLILEHDADDDGNTVEDGDCDDTNPAVALGLGGCHRSMYGLHAYSEAETLLLPSAVADWVGRTTLLADLDGDGLAEIATIAGDDVAFLANPGAGAFTLDVVASARIVGTKPFGTLAATGDVDGDGLPDLLASDPNGKFNNQLIDGGIGYVFRGPPVGNLSTADSYAELPGDFMYGTGWSGQRGAGDLDGDGIVDLVVGSPYIWPGLSSVFVQLGPLAGGNYPVVLADLELTAPETDMGLGSAPTRADWDGDGLPDLVADAAGWDGTGLDRGAVFVVQSPPPIGGATDIDTVAMATLEGDNGDLVGAGMAPVGDVDGDGLEDLGIPANGSDLDGVDSGAVYLASGGPLGVTTLSATAIATFSGEPNSGGAGTYATDPTARPFSVAPAGDFDGDGSLDVVVGAQYAGDGGAAYVLFGPFAGVLGLDTAGIHLVGSTDDRLGVSVAGGAELDGDGYPDVLVGAWLSDEYLFQGGYLAVLYGGPP